MTAQKPTGVFVRLPLSDEQRELMVDAAALGQPDDSHDKAIIAIGLPVQGGNLEVVGYADAVDLPLDDGSPTNWTADINAKPDETCTVSLVRQSDAQAQIAARDAEIGRLRAVINKMTSMSMNSGAWLSNNRIANCRDELSAMTRLGSNTLKGGAA